MLIRSGELGPGVLVWKPSWQEWRPLGQVEDFASFFSKDRRATPPPLPRGTEASDDIGRGPEGRLLGGIDWVWCPSGTLWAANPLPPSRRAMREECHRGVNLTQGFWIGKFPVTRGQWLKWMMDDPGGIPGRDSAMPVGNVNWHDAKRFCQRMTREKGIEVRLPTEAEWEYACRAGSDGPWCFGSNNALDLRDYAWFSDNSHGRCHPVGQKKPNAWGIHDTHGNVWEWCEDLDASDPAHGAADCPGFEVETCGDDRRICRGGSWHSPAERCRSSYRHRVAAGKRLHRLGFRVVADFIP